MFLIGSVLILCLLAACTEAGQPAVQPTNVTIGTIVVVPTPGMPTPRPTRTYSPEALTAIAVKEANLQGERDYEATIAALPPAPMHTGAPTYSPQPTEVRPFGIGTFEECNGADTHIPRFLLWTCWHGMLNGVYSAVVAGAEQVEPTPGEWTRGGIYVVSPADGSVPRSLIYWTPIKAGRLEIIAVDGTRVTLRSSNGTLFVFDAIALQWMPPDPTPASSSDPTPVTTQVPTYVIYAQRVQATAEAIAPTIPTPSLQQGTYGDIYFVGATGESTQTFGGGAAWQKLWPALHGTTCTGARPMTFTTTAGYCIPDPTCP